MSSGKKEGAQHVQASDKWLGLLSLSLSIYLSISTCSGGSRLSRGEGGGVVWSGVDKCVRRPHGDRQDKAAPPQRNKLDTNQTNSDRPAARPPLDPPLGGSSCAAARGRRTRMHPSRSASPRLHIKLHRMPSRPGELWAPLPSEFTRRLRLVVMPLPGHGEGRRTTVAIAQPGRQAASPYQPILSEGIACTVKAPFVQAPAQQGCQPVSFDWWVNRPTGLLELDRATDISWAWGPDLPVEISKHHSFLFHSRATLGKLLILQLHWIEWMDAVQCARGVENKGIDGRRLHAIALFGTTDYCCNNQLFYFFFTRMMERKKNCHIE